MSTPKLDVFKERILCKLQGPFSSIPKGSFPLVGSLYCTLYVRVLVWPHQKLKLAVDLTKIQVFLAQYLHCVSPTGPKRPITKLIWWLFPSVQNGTPTKEISEVR